MSTSLHSFISGLAPLKDEKLKLMSSFWRPQSLKKENYFIRVGNSCNRIGFIESGLLRTEAKGPENQNVVCSFINRHKFVSDIEAYLNQAPATSNYIAVSDCELLVLDYKAEQELIAAMPEWLTIREKIIVYMMNYFLDLHAMQVHQDARQRYRNFINKFPEVLQAAPLSQIASFLGVAQPSLSRIRKEA